MMLKILHSMLPISILDYKKFRKNIKSIGYKVNPYNIFISIKLLIISNTLLLSMLII